MIYILIPMLLLAGCASFERTVPEIHTVKTDFDPSALTRSEYYEQMGTSFSQEGQSEKAIEFLRLALVHDPENVPARITLASEYLKIGRKHLAITELDVAYTRQPGNFTVLHKMAELYVSTGIYSKASEIYEYMISLKPNSKKARWALAYITLAEKKYEQSHRWLDELKPLLTKNDELAQMSFAKVGVYRAQNDVQNYRLALTEAYSLNPRQLDIVNEYAAVFSQQGEFERATQVLAGYAQTQPYNTGVSESLSDSAIRSGNYDMALAEIEKQIESGDSDYMITHLKKARVYYLMGESSKAADQYEDILRDYRNDEAMYYLAQLQNSDNAGEKRKAEQLLSEISPASDYYGKAQASLAHGQYQRGNTDEAMEMMKNAYNRRRDQIEIYRTYGAMLLEEKDFQRAAVVLENGVQEFPKDEDLRLKSAFAYYRTGNTVKFDEQIQAASKMNPQNGEVYALLAELWYADGKNSEELSFLVKKAVALKSENKNIKPILAWVLMQQNRTPEAVALFEEAYEQDPQQPFIARSLAQIYAAADVNVKAREMSRVATALELNRELKSGMKNEDILVPSQRTLRLPASVKD